MAFNSDPNVYTLTEALTQDPDAKGKVYSKLLHVSAATADDLKKFEGSPQGNSPVWVQRELSAEAGDIIKMTAIGGAGGPGVRGEAELTGNTSKPRIGGNTVQVDFWRDAVELTKKQIKMLAAGQSIEGVCIKMVGEKLGRQKQNDGLIKMIRSANGNIYRPGNRSSRDAILAVDGLTPSAVVEAKARAQGRGARPLGITKSKSGSPVLRYMCFSAQDSLTEFRNSSTWTNAILQGASRGDDNPAFSGRLFDWQGTDIWEHIVVDPDADDYKGSAIAAQALVGVAITAASTGFDLKQSANTKPLYFQFFPGYDYIWVEGQTAAPDSNTYYAWIVDPAQSGKAMFVSYTGTGNTGNKIAITGRLGPTVAGVQNTTLGSIAYNATYHTVTAGVGSHIIPANAKGTPIGHSFIMGAGALLRGIGQIEAQRIMDERDYGFVKGMGYEGIWGHNVALDSEGKPRNYVLIEHAIEYSGIAIPGTYGV